MASLGDLMNSIRDAGTSMTGEDIGPAVRGVGRGASYGLYKYPASMIMLALDKLVGEGKMTRAEAMETLNRQQDDDRAQHPYAAYGGEIAGAFVPGGQGKLVQLAAGPGAKMVSTMQRGMTVPGASGTTARVAQSVARGAGQGAAGGGIAGYMEHQDTSEAVRGATLGGALGAGAAGAQRAQAAFVTNRAATMAQKNIKQLTEEILDNQSKQSSGYGRLTKYEKAAKKGQPGAAEAVAEQTAELRRLKSKESELQFKRASNNDTWERKASQEAGELIDNGNPNIDKWNMFEPSPSDRMRGFRADLFEGAKSDLAPSNLFSLQGSGYGAALGAGAGGLAYLMGADPGTAMSITGLGGASGAVLRGKSRALGAAASAAPDILPRAAGALNTTLTPYVATEPRRREASASLAANTGDDLDALFESHLQQSSTPKVKPSPVQKDDLDALFESYLK